MSYTVQKECSIMLVYDGKGYRFDALSAFSFSQTYNRVSNARKTLHARNSKPNTIVGTKNVADFSMSVLPTNSFIESVLFDLIGLNRVADNEFEYPDTINQTPKTCDVYVLTLDNDIFKFTPTVLNSIDIGLSKENVTQINVAFSAGDMTKVADFPDVSGQVYQGEIVHTPCLHVAVNKQIRNSVVSAGIAIQQSVSWRMQRSLHDIGDLYVATKPILTELTLGININTYLDSNIAVPEKPEILDFEIYKDYIYIKILKSLTTRRIESSEIFTEAYDVSLTEQSKAYVEYGGVII